MTADAQSLNYEPGAYLISNVTILSIQNGVMSHGQDVYVQDGKILSVNAHDQTAQPDLWTIIDASDKYLVPGISEMHAHIPTPADGNDENVRETLFLYLSNGITTIRGMLGDPYHLTLKTQIDEGTILSPRVYTSSPSLNGNSVQSEEEARTKVAQYARDGYDFLKIHPGIQLPVMKALVRTANSSGIKFAGHVPADVGVRNAMRYGYASIDHVDGFVEGLTPKGTDLGQGGFFGSEFTDIADIDKLDALCKMAVESEVWIVPTQSLFTRWISPTPPGEMIQAREMSYMSPATRFQWVNGKSQLLNSGQYDEQEYNAFLTLRQHIIRSLHQAGVGFLLGSDAPQVFNVPGFSIQHEMQSLIDCGLTPLHILQSGTINPARFFDREGEFGEISPGFSADLILLDGNPMDDIANMKKIHGVMVRGHWLDAGTIQKELDRIADRHAE